MLASQNIVASAPSLDRALGRYFRRRTYSALSGSCRGSGREHLAQSFVSVEEIYGQLLHAAREKRPLISSWLERATPQVSGDNFVL
jgi:hypothetical protein